MNKLFLLFIWIFVGLSYSKVTKSSDPVSISSNSLKPTQLSRSWVQNVIDYTHSLVNPYPFQKIEQPSPPLNEAQQESSQPSQPTKSRLSFSRRGSLSDLDTNSS